MGNKHTSRGRKGTAHQRVFGFTNVARPGKKLGRKRSKTAGPSHLARPALAKGTPMHITIKLKGGLPPLRTDACWRVVTGVLSAFHKTGRMRVCQFTIQHDHMHLVCEGPDAATVSKAMCSLKTRLAKRLNALWKRTGKIFADRYHRQDLTSPRQVRNTLRYVFGNTFKHAPSLRRHVSRSGKTRPDPYSSGAWFDGFREAGIDQSPEGGVARCTEPPQSWLLTRGWRRHGLLSVLDRPTAR